MIPIVLYFTLYPVLLWGIAFAHKKFFIDRPQKKKGRNVGTLPAPLWGKWWQRLRFTFTDKRQIIFESKKKKAQREKSKEAPKPGPARNLTYWALYLAGAIIALLGFVLPSEMLVNIITLSATLFYISAIFGINSSKKLLTQRENMMNQMLEIASARMQVDKSQGPYKVIKIAEWRTPENPGKITIEIPTTFDMSGEKGFETLFNQKFGRVTAWVPDTNYSEGIAGWDYEKGILTLRSVPPLPKKAPWDAKYVLHPAIAWSFFPLALGVENGVKIDFGDGSPPEHILGIDFSGEQPDVGAKNGAEVAPSVVRAPMALVAGGTGGGKSFSLSTPVLRLTPIED